MSGGVVGGTVSLVNRIPGAAYREPAKFAAVVQETGRDLTDATKANMVPGHAYLSGYMHDHTTWKKTGPLTGMVLVDAPYAGFVENGTVNMEPRPFLRPAIAQHWPRDLYKNAVNLRIEAIL